MSRAPLGGIDALLLDLDGVVYRGPNAVPHAVDALNGASARGVRVGYITNNASRRPDTVAAQLQHLGLAAASDDVITSPQATVHLLGERLSAGARVLVIGGDGLLTAVRDAGYTVVHSADDAPDAVVQGFAPTLAWTDLAEASFALAVPERLWIATNTDWTIPVERGTAPGNGTLVSAVHAAVGRLPLVAGKPERAIFDEAVRRFDAHAPLMVGDRLDTDIKGAFAAGMPSAFVFTGVDGVLELLRAPEDSRPTFLLRDLRGLTEPYPEARRTRRGIRVGDAEVGVEAGAVVVYRDADELLDVVRAACLAVWDRGESALALRLPEWLQSAKVR